MNIFSKDMHDLVRTKFISFFFVLITMASVPIVHASAQELLEYDTPTTVSGVEVACTGIATNTRDDPRWGPYPLKIEVTGPGGQYLANVRIVITRNDAQIVDLICDGPWILARLEPAEYIVAATFEGASTSARVDIPSTGQSRLVLWFPQAAGAVSRERALGIEAPDDPAPPGEENENAAPALRLGTDGGEAVSAVSGGAVLQVGSFRSEARANEGWQMFRAQYSEITANLVSNIQEADLGERGVWYRLRISPFDDNGAANDVCNLVKAQGGDCFAAAP